MPDGGEGRNALRLSALRLLPVGADTGIAKMPILRVSLGHILC